MGSSDRLVFEVHAEFDLDEKPDWLDGFRRVYDEPYRYHITLKPTTFVQPADVPELKDAMRAIARDHALTRVMFSRIEKGRPPKGWCLMVRAVPNEALDSLQQEVSMRCSSFGTHTNPAFERFESAFEPHITIARHLDDRRLTQALSEIGADVHCTASIRAITLTIAADDSFEALNDPVNKMVFALDSHDS